MSISRLWVWSWKCSRESLSLKGPRITVYLLRLVGSGTGPKTKAPVRSAVSTIDRAVLSMTSWSYALSLILIFETATNYSTISVTTPAPTVRPPSLMAKFKPSSMAIGEISSTFITVLSPGITISTPSSSLISPVTSVVLK